MCETGDSRNRWASLIVQSWENISDFWCSELKSLLSFSLFPHTLSRPDPLRLLISAGPSHCPWWSPPASGSQSAPHHDQSPTQTSRAHNHKSHPGKHSPTTGLHKNIPQHHRESYCPTNLSFLPHKSSELLNNYVLELGFFLNWRRQQQAATSLGVWALM